MKDLSGIARSHYQVWDQRKERLSCSLLKCTASTLIISCCGRNAKGCQVRITRRWSISLFWIWRCSWGIWNNHKICIFVGNTASTRKQIYFDGSDGEWLKICIKRSPADPWEHRRLLETTTMLLHRTVLFAVLISISCWVPFVQVSQKLCTVYTQIWNYNLFCQFACRPLWLLLRPQQLTLLWSVKVGMWPKRSLRSQLTLWLSKFQFL